MSDKDAVKMAADAAEEIEREDKEEDDLITLSNGVVLRAKQIPYGLLIKVMARFPRPKVYSQFNEIEQRLIQNPDHPDYIEAVRDWNAKYAEALLNTMLLYGTEAVSTPKKVPTVKSNDWLEGLEVIGEPTFPENKSWRYLMWILTIAAIGDVDFNLITKKVGRLSGIREEDVQKAAEFPGSDKTS